MEKQSMSLAGTPGIAMCCLFEISTVVPGVSQSWQAGHNTSCPIVEPSPGPSHLDPQTLQKTMTPIQQQTLASPPKRWVSFRAGYWKSLSLGRVCKHPKPDKQLSFQSSEPWRSGTMLVGRWTATVCICLCLVETREGPGSHSENHSVFLPFLSSPPTSLPTVSLCNGT